MGRVLVRRTCVFLVIFVTACLTLVGELVVAHAGEPARLARAATNSPDLNQIIQHSGLIFLGQVERIEWKHALGDGSAQDGSAERVRITFRVLDGIRGVRTGETVEVDEWSGLWTPGVERYRTGETLFLFFYPRSRLGLTSPVAGDDGRIALTPAQRVVLSPERSTTLLPRSLRLQKNQAAVDALRAQRSTVYIQFAQIVRELAGVAQ